MQSNVCPTVQSDISLEGRPYRCIGVEGMYLPERSGEGQRMRSNISTNIKNDAALFGWNKRKKQSYGALFVTAEKIYAPFEIRRDVSFECNTVIQYREWGGFFW
jgi:hypothetical protein